jgi:hypothetical protein
VLSHVIGYVLGSASYYPPAGAGISSTRPLLDPRFTRSHLYSMVTEILVPGRKAAGV